MSALHRHSAQHDGHHRHHHYRHEGELERYRRRHRHTHYRARRHGGGTAQMKNHHSLAAANLEAWKQSPEAKALHGMALPGADTQHLDPAFGGPLAKALGEYNAAHPKSPILINSGYRNDDYQAHLYHSGKYDVVAKPISEGGGGSDHSRGRAVDLQAPAKVLDDFAHFCAKKGYPVGRLADPALAAADPVHFTLRNHQGPSPVAVNHPMVVKSKNEPVNAMAYAQIAKQAGALDAIEGSVDGGKPRADAAGHKKGPAGKKGHAHDPSHYSSAQVAPPWGIGGLFGPSQ